MQERAAFKHCIDAGIIVGGFVTEDIKEKNEGNYRGM